MQLNLTMLMACARIVTTLKEEQRELTFASIKKEFSMQKEFAKIVTSVPTTSPRDLVEKTLTKTQWNSAPYSDYHLNITDID